MSPITISVTDNYLCLHKEPIGAMLLWKSRVIWDEPPISKQIGHVCNWY